MSCLATSDIFKMVSSRMTNFYIKENSTYINPAKPIYFQYKIEIHSSLRLLNKHFTYVNVPKDS